MTTLYGLTNCDTCRRARHWLQERDVDYDWIDLDRDSIERAVVERWLGVAVDQTILNRRSKTWRDLDDEQRQLAETDPATAITERPRLLKRPLLEANGQIVTGFSADQFARALNISGDLITY